ncbi:actin-related protein 6 [Geosmithia morbida]|uniref:Actin-like protein ARP6 n=1 Tax=Geosmithia morbida TaxID=1094350 RepID=A0A9P5D109_9HYPO|nr:actin-related protein 6 [Geosmithia morbida]KAF4122222.1 actin-related protein 6 [Geosmithia morbida]
MAGGRKQPAPSPQPQKTLVIDNGASTLKAGLVSGSEAGEPLVIPNCIARDRYKKIYVAQEVDKCRDFSEILFRRPVDRGFVVNWEAQRDIWDRQFLYADGPLRCDPGETRLILTEPPNSLPVLQSNCDQIVFEEYGFVSYHRGIGTCHNFFCARVSVLSRKYSVETNDACCVLPGSTFNAYHDLQDIFRTPLDYPGVTNTPAEVMLVVDSGYSHTTVTPLLGGRPLHSAVRRLDVGGKLLTNYLARLLSLRHFDMRNETYIVNEMKEVACFVSSDFKADMEKCWKGTRGEKRPDFLTGGGIAKEYILPDFDTRSKGLLCDYDPARHSKARRMTSGTHVDEDALTLRSERFAIPELLFNPSDMGMRQPGLPALIRQSLESLPTGLWPGLLANIVVVGGNTLFDGFIQRLQQEIVQQFPDDCVVRVARCSDPITSTWHGAANLARHRDIETLSVTKQEYDEHGQSRIARKFSLGPGFEWV